MIEKNNQEKAPAPIQSENHHKIKVLGLLIVGVGLLVATSLVFVKVPELISNVNDDRKKIEYEKKYNNYEDDLFIVEHIESLQR